MEVKIIPSPSPDEPHILPGHLLVNLAFVEVNDESDLKVAQVATGIVLEEEVKKNGKSSG